MYINYSENGTRFVLFFFPPKSKLLKFLYMRFPVGTINGGYAVAVLLFNLIHSSNNFCDKHFPG